MSRLAAETEFFHDIAQACLKLVLNSDKEVAIVQDKGAEGYATQLDIDVENLIVSELKKHFGNDQILAEEGYSDTVIPTTRIWLIDPICGTSNLGKGINNFCSNIALIDNAKVIASCVVDHSQGQYFWSTRDNGDNKVYINNNAYNFPALELGRKVDVDFGSVRKVNKKLQRKHNNCLMKLIENTDYDLISLNSSLGFAYTAIGKTDGFINMFNHPWDICAASFLIQQAGGVITALDGTPWTVNTVGAIGGRTPEVHQELLSLFLDS